MAALERLVNGSTSTDFPNATYLRDNLIYSPRIAGTLGYISQSFGVGEITGNKGIILTAKGYGYTGSFIRNVPAIFIGGTGETGSFDSSDTPFLAASGSQGALFSLGKNLKPYKDTTDNMFKLVISGSVISTNNLSIFDTTGRLDTRAWDNLPQFLSFALVQLSPGQHEVTVEFHDAQNRPVSNLTKTLTVNVPTDRDKVVFVSDTSTTPQTQ